MDTANHFHLRDQYEYEMYLINDWIDVNAPYAKIKKMKDESYISDNYGYNQVHIDYKLSLLKSDAIAFKLEFL